MLDDENGGTASRNDPARSSGAPAAVALRRAINNGDANDLVAIRRCAVVMAVVVVVTTTSLPGWRAIVRRRLMS